MLRFSETLPHCSRAALATEPTINPDYAGRNPELRCQYGNAAPGFRLPLNRATGPASTGYPCVFGAQGEISRYIVQPDEPGGGDA